MSAVLKRRARLLVAVLGLVVLLALAGAAWIHHLLRASLPQLDGAQTLRGLSTSVAVTRDALGIPTIRGANREDVARAFGFLHAQDRFFQMDLLRRRAAGELAELFGKVALPLDRATRPHHFRPLAQKVLAALPAKDRSLLETYTAGVNAGLAALGGRPFEYVLLRDTPSPWKAEDSVLIVYAMTLDLQDATNNYERSLATLRDTLGPEAVNFFAPLLTPTDAALDGSTAPLSSVPGPEFIDLRPQSAPLTHSMRDTANESSSAAIGELRPGSNSFALSGAHTASGAGLLANDPHLNLGVPNIWYRAVLEWPATDDAAPSENRVVGVSLAGLPFIVLGSNGQIAWGLTDAYADTNDLVVVEPSPTDERLYQVTGREELMEIETRSDTLRVKGSTPETVETDWTIWGPIIGRDSRNRPLAHRWVAYDAAATNLNFMRLESARNVTEAIAVAQDSGIPANTFLVVDRAGDIAWTVAGKFPKRMGFDGRLPASWKSGDKSWEGFVPAQDVPLISTAKTAGPAGAKNSISLIGDASRLWTANNRLVGGRALALLGDGGYAPPPRGSQIRDQLMRLEQATPQDFLKIQLDDRGLFLDRWQKLLLQVLTPERISEKSSRATLRRLVEQWDGRASVESVSYRLVRTFRSVTADLVLTPIFASCTDSFPAFNWHRFNFDPPLWTMLEQKPQHLLAPEFATWDDLLLAAADGIETRIEREGTTLEHATWGDRNRARIRHPLAGALPLGLGQRLNLPADRLPGDIHMPLIQNPTFGASMRLVVSPGREDEAILQMPGGQSGHPLSRFYQAGHPAWVQGEPAPLLPGETRHTLHLVPTLAPSGPGTN